ncbi:SsrA-binding protein SmpB [Salibacterium salarium]|uniref:SsrA-binding protein n=1 Tax=Salibacterium salarium TaxID=284579 RepID=A0A3R9QHV6_9BACI|nr:SsrA-binding protein SmpB [Salibacterium salarium]RSL30745.1 SsrA-binding protein SmpB [Salibacterium salarium]
MATKTEGRVLAQNRKARHDFFIEETFEAGLVLKGTEIKAIRAGKINIKDSFAKVDNGEMQLHNAHVSHYEQGNQFNHEPLRTRKLLLHRREINQLIGKSQQSGYSIIPLKVYIKHGVAKVLIGLARGKKKYDKRQALKEKDAKREMDRAVRRQMKGE